jgi:tape measure domain-containing protein
MHITQALNMTVSALDSVETHANTAFDTATLSGMKQHVAAANIELEEMKKNIQESKDEQDKHNKALDTGAASSGKLLSSLTKIAATYFTIQSAVKVLGLSDTLTLTESRLSLIVDDGGSVDALEQKIFASSQRARASYLNTLSSVSKLGLLAGDAFKNNDEIIAFQELMNKNFIVGGASGTEQASAMYQLTQAMASGKLQGDEYRSIIENAPLLAKAIEDYMINVKGVRGSMKDWASEGLLTADVIKAALFSSADEIEERFNALPMTFGQIWASVKNDALLNFQPVLAQLSEIANSERFSGLVSGITGVLSVVSSVVLVIFNAVAAVGGFMYDNWSILSPVIYSAAAALAVYYGWMLRSKAVTIAHTVATWAQTTAQGALTLAKMLAVPVWALLTGSTMAATAAQWGLNVALYACPLVWIMIIIIAIIGLFYAVIGIINKVAGTSVSATGIIFGVFSVLGAFLWNLFLSVFDFILGTINKLVNPFIRFANFIGNIFTNPISSIIYLFQSMADGVLAVLEKIASAMDFVFGSNMADTVSGWREGLKDMADAAVAKYAPNENYQNVMDELNLSAEGLGLKRAAYSNAWNAGYSAGDSLGNIGDTAYDTADKDTSQYLSAITANTDVIADSTELSSEELMYLRDIAERDAVNKFTTAEVTVSLGGVTNNVASNVDLDGLVTYIADKTAEELDAVAEGVHD